MQDNLIRSGNAFFAPAGDNRHNHEQHDLNKSAADNGFDGRKGDNESEKSGENRVSVRAENVKGGCDYRTGDLPECAPLAAGFVPWQRSAEPVYEADEALTRGTLFPGLDLPFMDIANKNNPYAGTHLGDLMAISFVTHELKLYLDTHPKDGAAFSLLQKMLRLSREAHSRFVKMHGPISADDLLESDSFTWVHGPWPWETPAPGTGHAHTGSAEGK